MLFTVIELLTYKTKICTLGTDKNTGILFTPTRFVALCTAGS